VFLSQRIVESCKKAGVKYCLVEMDRCTIDPFEGLKISLENMKKWGIET